MDTEDDESTNSDLDEKEAEERFTLWYNDVVQERVEMLEAEEGYKKRIKELETGLSDLLKGFDQAEREIHILRNKYEPKNDSDIYIEPYNIVLKERDKMKETEKRNKHVIERLETENAILRDRLKRIHNDEFSMFPVNNEHFKEFETQDMENDTIIYTRKNILNYKKEIQTLLIKSTDRKTIESPARRSITKRDRSHFKTKNGCEVKSTYAKYFTKMQTPKKHLGSLSDSSVTSNGSEPDGIVGFKRFSKGLVVVANSEKLERLEVENRKLKETLDDMEHERLCLVKRMTKFQLNVMPRSRFILQTSEMKKGKNVMSRFPRLTPHDGSSESFKLLRKSSSFSSASTDIPSPRDHVDNRHVYKTNSRTSMFSDGYVSIFKARKSYSSN